MQGVSCWAVVPTRSERPALLRECVAALSDCDGIVLVDTARDGLPLRPFGKVCIVDARTGERNVSRWWNAGAVVATLKGATHIAYVNDDAIVPGGWATGLANNMDVTGAAAGFTVPSKKMRLRKLPPPGGPSAPPGESRMTGWAFMVSVKSGLRFDEDLKWWGSDDDLEWRAAAHGGVLVSNYAAVRHLHPNEATNADPALAAQTVKDRGVFVAKWGCAPW